MNSNEKKNNNTPELNDDDLEQVAGGRHGWHGKPGMRGKPGMPGMNENANLITPRGAYEVTKIIDDPKYAGVKEDVIVGQFTVRVAGDGVVKASGTIDGMVASGTSDMVIE